MRTGHACVTPLIPVLLAVVFACVCGCGGGETPQPYTLADIRGLAAEPAASKTSGLIVFQQDRSNPLRLDLDGEITQTFDATGGRLANTKAGLYMVGLRHKFIGTCVFPVSPDEIATDSLHLRIEPKGHVEQVTTQDGPIARNGTIVIQGSGLFIKSGGASAISIESSGEHPLIFELTADGYRYVEGRGKVTALDGTTTVLPKTDS